MKRYLFVIMVLALAGCGSSNNDAAMETYMKTQKELRRNNFCQLLRSVVYDRKQEVEMAAESAAMEKCLKNDTIANDKDVKALQKKYPNRIITVPKCRYETISPIPTSSTGDDIYQNCLQAF